MTAFTVFIVTIGVFVSVFAHQDKPPEPPSVSVQRFQHIVRNGEDIHHKIQKLVPEAQQIIQDTVRIFNEFVFRAATVFTGSPEVEGTVTESSNAVRQKRDTSDQSVILGVLKENPAQKSCDEPLSEFAIMKRIFGSDDRKKRSTTDDFNPMEIDPVNFEVPKLYVDNEQFDNENDEEIIRHKRLAQQQRYEMLSEKLDHCKANIPGGENCGHILDEIASIVKELNQNLYTARNMYSQVRALGPKDHPNFKEDRPQVVNFFMPVWDKNALITTKKHEVPKSERSALKDCDQTTSDVQPIYPVHEDLLGSAQTDFTGSKFFADFDKTNFQPGSPRIFNQNQQNNRNGQAMPINSNNNQQNTSPNKPGSDFVGASGPFINLCENLARQNKIPSLIPLNNGNNGNNNINTVNNRPFTQPSAFQNSVSFTSNQGSHTGETMKATAQLIFNPGI